MREREREKAHARGRERVREKALWLLLLYVFFFFLHLGLPYANWAYPGVLFVLPEVFTLVLEPSLSFSYRHFGLLPYSTYLTFPPQEMGGPILWEYGHRGLSGYFLLNWDGEGYWASPSC